MTTFDKSLTQLGYDNIYGYLIHHFNYYKENKSLWKEFNKLKNEGKVEKIGFSLYSTSELEYLLNHEVKFDLLQFPYNIFDKQFEFYFEKLRELNVEIHTRSVFLQGLFFKDINKIGGKLIKLIPYLEKIHNYCFKRNITIESLALNYVLENPYINGVLIGVDNKKQLIDNLKSTYFKISKTDIEFINSIVIDEFDLVNPTNW